MNEKGDTFNVSPFLFSRVIEKYKFIEPVHKNLYYFNSTLNKASSLDVI
jgi:hypothetical protein